MSYNNNFKQQLNNLKEEIKQCKDEEFDRLVYKYNLFKLVNDTLENDVLECKKHTEILNNDTEILNKIYNKYMDWIDAPNFVDENVLNEFLNEIENEFKLNEDLIEEEDVQ